MGVVREIKYRAWNKEEKIMYLSPKEIQHLGSWLDAHLPGTLANVDNIILMQYVEILHAYVGDYLYGEETDEYGSLMSSWYGIVKFNDEKGRIMILDDTGDWYEVDDYLYDEVSGNIYENPELLRGDK